MKLETIEFDEISYQEYDRKCGAQNNSRVLAWEGQSCHPLEWIGVGLERKIKSSSWNDKSEIALKHPSGDLDKVGVSENDAD